MLGNAVKGTVNASVVHDPGAFGFGPGYIGRVAGDLTWKVGNGLLFQFPIISFSDPISHTGNVRRPEVTFGMGFSFAHAH